MSDDIDLSLILPCYKEEEIFDESVRRVLETLDGLRCRYEVIFVEDKSPDSTRERVEGALKRYEGKPLRALFHERNQGRGAAVTTGIRGARGAVVGFIDIDLEVGPHYILPCRQAIATGADVVVGRRVYTLSVRSMLRNVLSKGYQAVARLWLGIPSWDTESGYKFFKREAALRLLEKTRDPGWFWDTEVMVWAKRLDMKVVEVPVLFLRRLDKTSTVRPLRDTLVYLKRLWAFRREGN